MTSTDPLRILLIDKDSERANLVKQALEQEGHDVISQRPDATGLTAAVARDEPDMVIIDMDLPDRDTLENMSTLNAHAPRPIVFCANEPADRATIKAALHAGVSAYVMDGLQPDRVRSIIDSAVVQFESFQALRTELAETRSALEDRKLIERAKGLIMKREGCDEDAAYQVLRKSAMDHSERLATIAQRVIEILGDEQTGIAPVRRGLKHAS
ncbi:ANTAR domain-containing response regulator [Marinobacter zhejiangensis]|uniref:Response regulator receiver and ANTAR domain protein n=1 Tax=Marinobacter zhejiangensis TaxID=488535 RepID=A0A1I4M108_9GAMM|nr:ANTAR domain-containing protein [Marinobacter zhejiangensis]SFL96931.1 response regulator receiver and ANTAR domain protein [Marinobacter zhejiangensis]